MRAIWYWSKLPSTVRPSLMVISCHIASLNRPGDLALDLLAHGQRVDERVAFSNTASTRSIALKPAFPRASVA
jgi:hypothetical protein